MQFINTLVPEDFRSVVSQPLKRFYLCTTLSCVGTGLTLSLFIGGNTQCGSLLMFRLRRRLSSREDGTELVASEV